MSNIERQNKLRKMQREKVKAEQRLSKLKNIIKNKDFNNEHYQYHQDKNLNERALRNQIKQIEKGLVTRQRKINQLKDSRNHFQEVKDWKRATGWVNKKVENPNWKAQQDQRRYSGSLGTAMWGYNKEEYIKSMNRGEEPEPFDDGTH